MKVFVINLRRSVSRRNFMAEQLDMLGLQYEFFDAVDGASLSQEEMQRVCNQRWVKRHIGRPMFPGEIGCALSHIGVYQKMVDENLPFVLVLEDDAQLGSSVAQNLNRFEGMLNPNDEFVCLLSEVATLGEELGALGEGVSWARVESAAYLAHAYVISLEGARKLCSALFPVVQVADDWGWIKAHTGVEVYACQPAIATQLSPGQSGSTISSNGELRGEDQTARLKCWSWWKEKFYRKWWLSVDRAGLGYYFWRKT